MTNFTQHTIESAPANSQSLLEGAQKAFGFVPNLLGTLAEAPASLEAYLTISGIVEKTSLNAVEQQVVLITTSVENACEYCVAAHSFIAKNIAKADASLVEALRNDETPADAKLAVLAEFTRLVVNKRGFVSDEDVAAFIAAGYTQANVLEVVVGVAQKTISNYTNHLAKVPLDAQFSSEIWSAPTSKAA